MSCISTSEKDTVGKTLKITTTERYRYKPGKNTTNEGCNSFVMLVGLFDSVIASKGYA